MKEKLTVRNFIINVYNVDIIKLLRNSEWILNFKMISVHGVGQINDVFDWLFISPVIIIARNRFVLVGRNLYPDPVYCFCLPLHQILSIRAITGCYDICQIQCFVSIAVSDFLRFKHLFD